MTHPTEANISEWDLADHLADSSSILICRKSEMQRFVGRFLGNLEATCQDDAGPRLTPFALGSTPNGCVFPKENVGVQTTRAPS